MAQHRDSQIDANLQSGIEQMKSHADLMKKVGAANDAMVKHRTLQQKHATAQQKQIAARGGGNAGAVPQKGAKQVMRKRVSAK